MPRKRRKAEEIVAKLRQVDVLTGAVHTGRGCDPPDWRDGDILSLAKQYGGLKSDQVRRIKALEQQKARLQRAISDLELDKMTLLGRRGAPAHRLRSTTEPLEQC